MNIYFFILARGGSKGLKHKNLRVIAGKSLVERSLEATQNCRIGTTILSSDDDKILSQGTRFPNIILHTRRAEHATDEASSDDTILGIIEDLNLTENNNGEDWGVLIQPTFPFLNQKNIEDLITCIETKKYDSIFSSNLVEDYFIWQQHETIMQSVTYDYKNRKRRQDIQPWIYENGAFYAFRLNGFVKNSNRLYGRIGHIPLETWQHHEIDNEEDLRICTAIFNEFCKEE